MRIRVLVALLLAAPFLAQAAGLGELKVSSKLGQPLRGEIPVVAIKPGEELLSAQIASLDAYAKAGLTLRPGVAGARVSIETKKGKPVIVIKGRQSVNEPAVDVLVELRWSTGQVLRAYRVLLDRPKV
jgi:pilus assembly protein FimV